MHSRVSTRALVRFAAAAALLGVIVAVLAVAMAGAGNGRYVVVTASDSNLWATINSCHGHKNPPSLGVRARMPADSNDERLYMRFYDQFKKDGTWHALDHSGWRYVGSGQMWWESGRTFDFKEPLPGQSFLIRGLVKFKWVQGGQVVRRAKRVTTAHHPTGTGKHPFSAAHCRIYGPLTRPSGA